MATSGLEDCASQWSEPTREGHGRFCALRNLEQLSWLHKMDLVTVSMEGEGGLMSPHP